MVVRAEFLAPQLPFLACHRVCPRALLVCWTVIPRPVVENPAGSHPGWAAAIASPLPCPNPGRRCNDMRLLRKGAKSSMNLQGSFYRLTGNRESRSCELLTH